MFVSCALLPVLILTVLTFNQVTASLEDQYRIRLQHMAKSVGMTIYERLLLLESNLEIIISGFDNLHPLFSFASEAQKKHYEQWFEGIVHLVPPGETTAVFKTIENVPEFSDNKYGQDYPGRTLVLSDNREQSSRIFMIKPLDVHIPATGFLVAEINTDFLWGVGNVNTIPQQTRISVLDQSNILLFNPFKKPQGMLREMERSKLVNGGNNRHFEFENDNINYLASFWSIFLRSNFAAPDWIVVLSQDKADVLEPLHHFERIFPLVILLSVWIVLLLSIIYIRKSLVPLESLKTGTERIAQGDFSSRVEVNSKDEFADLAYSFNAMSGQLSGQFNTLTTMSEIDRAILSSLETDTIVDTMLSRLFSFLNCEMVAIGLVTPDNGKHLHYSLQDKEKGVVRLEQGAEMTPAHAKQLLSGEVVIDTGEKVPDYLTLLQHYSATAYAVIPLVLKEKLAGVFVLGYAEGTIKDKEDDIAHASQLATQMAVALANSHLIEELERLSWGAIQAFGRTVDAKSSWTAGHSERVTIYALQIAQAIPLSKERQEILRRAAFLHDIGKIGVPVTLLDKNGKLTDEEYDAVKKHPAMGARILEPIGAFEEIIPIIKQHHEHYDGNGYPDGLQEGQITLEGRILAVADVFDALISDRPYREKWTREKIVLYMQEKAGTQFDPEIVAIFLNLLENEAITLNPLTLFESEYGLKDELVVAASSAAAAHW